MDYYRVVLIIDGEEDSKRVGSLENLGSPRRNEENHPDSGSVT